MPRKDVPYPSEAICNLKERIAELEQRMASLVNTINHIAANSGDISIAADAPLNVTNDATAHKIEISLDTSRLPAAAVSSVNGKTGAVALDAEDIPTRGNANVQTDIDVGKADLKNCIVNIIAEREARQNADAALQTNINSANAAIDMKVDKIATAGTSAYTHKGAEQGETAVADGTAADTIPIRDANGRVHAADPASGATDKTLVNASWVSQSGDDAPNNLVHKIGSETINGVKIFSEGIKTYSNNFHATNISGQAINDISLFARLDNSLHGKYIIFDAIQSSNTCMCAGQFMVNNRPDNMEAMWLWRKGNKNLYNPLIGKCLVIANKNEEYYLGWRKLNIYGSIQVRDNLAWSYAKIDSYPTKQIEWIDKINIGTGDGYIITEVEDASTYTQ